MSEISYTDVRTQEMVEALLHAGETTVVFTKVDGSERTMRCTLNEELIPVEFKPKGESKLKHNDDVRAVYDLDNTGWRSFRWDSVTEVTA